MKVESINIILENCEVIGINRQYVGAFYITDIKRTISRLAMNSISDTINSDEIFIQVSSKANDVSAYLTTWGDNTTKPFDRIRQHNDITAIEIVWENKTNEYIYVDWGGNSDYTNSNQTSAINETTGDLYIAVSENETVSEFFKVGLIEKEAEYWSLYED